MGTFHTVKNMRCFDHISQKDRGLHCHVAVVKTKGTCTRCWRSRATNGALASLRLLSQFILWGEPTLTRKISWGFEIEVHNPEVLARNGMRPILSWYYLFFKALSLGVSKNNGNFTSKLLGSEPIKSNAVIRPNLMSHYLAISSF